MPSEYKLYGVSKEEMYNSKSAEEKIKIRKEMVKMAKEKGIKPTARYYKTYPHTVRRWVKKFSEGENKDG